MKQSPKELYVTFFPCGKFGVFRTLEDAKGQGAIVARDRTCCDEGHDSFKVELWAQECVVVGFTESVFLRIAAEAQVPQDYTLKTKVAKRKRKIELPKEKVSAKMGGPLLRSHAPRKPLTATHLRLVK
jgi:hypothetical protein